MNKSYVGSGKVVLIAGGGKTYCDVAANFCRAEEDLQHLITDEETKKIIRHLIDSGHTSALEFDQFIFGIEGYARVTEVQLVRKRLASYNIKSGRVNKHGKRSFDVVIPEAIEAVEVNHQLDPSKLRFVNDSKVAGDKSVYTGNEILNTLFADSDEKHVEYTFTTDDILNLIEDWYNHGVIMGVPEEELRYLKPQATEFKAAIRMDAAALRNWFMIRCCYRAQKEIRDLAMKMQALCKQASPTLFEGSGPSCVVYGYCPETEQCKERRGKVFRKKDALKILQTAHEQLEAEAKVQDDQAVLHPVDQPAT